VSLKKFWADALAAGLFPLSIGRGTKAPIGLWRENAHPTPEPHPEAAAVGIRCLTRDGVSAIDVDCVCAASPTYLGILRRELPTPPVRYGKRPKFLIPFRCEGTIERRGLTLPCGCKMQILSDGQFLAWGEHPDTQQPYEWDNFENPWPTLNQISLYALLSYLGVNATADARNYVSELDLSAEAPQNDNERSSVRQIAEHRLNLLTNEIRNLSEGRGVPIFNAVACVAPAVHWGILTHEDISRAVGAAGHALDDKRGGRTLGEEITRALDAGVLTSNFILQKLGEYRTFIRQALGGGITEGGNTLKLLNGAKFHPVKFVVEELLPEGFILFSAKPKVGKSYIMLDLGLSVLDGAVFWGYQCMQGDVIVYSFEDTDRRLQDRYRALRPAGVANENSFLYFTGDSGVPRLAAAPGEPCFTHHLEREIAKRPNTRLIVIDPIISIRADQRDKTKGLYQVDYDNIKRIQQVAAKHGITIVGVHHSNKKTDVIDPADMVSGSTGMTAAADGMWMMEPDKERESAQLHTQMRDTSSISITLTRKKIKGGIKWEPLETPQEIAKVSDIERRILAAVMAGGCEATIQDLIARCPDVNDGTLRVYVRRMSGHAKAMLQHTTRGLYITPGGAAKSRPEGARDMLVSALNGGKYSDYQAGKVVDVRQVLPHLAHSDRTPVTEGCAVSLDAARGLLSMFHDPRKLIGDMESRKLAFVFDKVLLIPHTVAPVHVASSPVITLTEAFKNLWAKPESFPWG
jgi:hypothetical protein